MVEQPKYARGMIVIFPDGAAGNIVKTVGRTESDEDWQYEVARLDLTTKTVPESQLAEPVTDEVARHVLYYRGKPGGLDGGGFVRALLRTIESADEQNRAKLRTAYPGYVAALLDWWPEDLAAHVLHEDAAE